MSAAVVLAELRGAGLTVGTREGRVVLAPRERVTPRLVELVKEHKPAILAALATEGRAGEGTPAAPSSAAAGEMPHQAPASVPGAPPGPARDPLATRRAFVVRQLEVTPGRYAFDVEGAGFRPGDAPPGAPPVSVVLAIRTPQGIVTGELHIPRERWDMAGFLAELDRAAALEPAPADATLH